MPPAAELREIFSQDTTWWDTWHMKTFGTTVTSETLSQFLDRVYQRGTVVELGFLLSALGRQDPGEATHYLPLVDRLILADDRYAGTLDGLLLAAFHAKVYLDVGQPHRGFLCNRRGISLAQSMVMFPLQSDPKLLMPCRIFTATIPSPLSEALCGGPCILVTAFYPSYSDCRIPSPTTILPLR
jgi:hypothetical protein